MKQKNETKVKQIITNKFDIICSPFFPVLFFENNLIKKIDIKIKSPKGIRKAPIKELINRIIIKISNGLAK
ncbi:hypothetical protein IJX73_01000 [bacterium]|nr:hypothetical protein [bacterium]